MAQRIALAFLLLLAFLAPGTSLAAAPQFPQLTGRVVDAANLLDAGTRERLIAKSEQLEQRTGRQLVIVTLPSLQGYEIEEFGYQLGRHWGIGERDRDTGALLIVAPNERQVRIEVGYGNEGVLTDAVSRLIIENAILPRFRAGDFAGGIERGADDIVQVLTGDAEDFQRRAAGRRPANPDEQLQFIWFALLLGFWLLAMLRSRRRRRRGWLGGLPLPFPIPMGGRGGRGGSFRGGGFRGGGGSFGGGGASGRW